MSNRFKDTGTASSVSVSPSPVSFDVVNPVRSLLLDIQAGKVTGNAIRDAVNTAMSAIGKPSPCLICWNGEDKNHKPVPYILSPEERLEVLVSETWPVVTLRDVFNVAKFIPWSIDQIEGQVSVRIGSRTIKGQELRDILTERQGDITLPAGSGKVAQPAVSSPAKVSPAKEAGSFLDNVKSALVLKGFVKFPAMPTDEIVFGYLAEQVEKGVIDASDDLCTFSVLNWSAPVETVKVETPAEKMKRIAKERAQSTATPSPSPAKVSDTPSDRKKLPGETFAQHMARLKAIDKGNPPTETLESVVGKAGGTVPPAPAENRVSSAVKGEFSPETVILARAIEAGLKGGSGVSEERVREIIREVVREEITLAFSMVAANRVGK
jgi:hypothetical protein